MSKTITEVDKFRAGSAKNKIYSRFVQVGEAAARKYALSVGIKASTLRQWTNEWKRTGTKVAAAKKRVPKKTAELVPAPAAE